LTVQAMKHNAMMSQIDVMKSVGPAFANPQPIRSGTE
jgi:hypothetical protein